MDEEMLNEKNSDVVEQPKKFKRKSNKFPPLSQNPALVLFVRQTTREIENMRNDNVIKLEPRTDFGTRVFEKQFWNNNKGI